MELRCKSTARSLVQILVISTTSMISAFTILTASRSQAADLVLDHSQVFLDSLYTQSRIQAPRLRLAAAQTFLAHPSWLQRWRIVGAEAAAMYNSFTNTLILDPELTIFEPTLGRERIRSLPEIRQSHGSYASPLAGVIFHELSHAEWDLYIEEEAEEYDRALLKVIRAETPMMAYAAGLSMLESRSLASEIFAYHREELIGMLLQDTNEIKLASGLDPDTNACFQIKKRPEVMRNLSPVAQPYSERVRLTTAFVDGQDVNLNLDPAANRRLNEALFEHARATLRFPENRAELLRQLSQDPRLRKAMATCLAYNSRP